MKTVRLLFSRFFVLFGRLSRNTAKLAVCRIRTLLSLSALIAMGFGAMAENSESPNIVPSQNNDKAVPASATAYEGFTGVGPAVAGSVDFNAIPSKARKFLQRHCDGHAVVKCNKQYLSGEYEIGLADGIEMEFDSKGKLTEIEAPEGYSLSPQLLRSVIPGKLYHLLEHNGFKESVEAVHHSNTGYRLEISDPVFSQVCFDSSGVLTLVVDK